MDVISQKFNVNPKMIEECINKISKKYDKTPQEIIDIVGSAHAHEGDVNVTVGANGNVHTTKNVITNTNNNASACTVDLYVDGSFSDRSPYAGWAWAIVIDNQHHRSESGKTDKPAQSRQIDGELYATMKGLEYIRMNTNVVSGGGRASNRREPTSGQGREPKIIIHYDYAGIENHLVNPSSPKYWRPKKPISLLYVKTMKELGLQNVSFQYVKAHTGNADAHSRWNDVVDGLAKAAIGIK